MLELRRPQQCSTACRRSSCTPADESALDDRDLDIGIERRSAPQKCLRQSPAQYDHARHGRAYGRMAPSGP
jgi:hypothetical protein